MISSIGKPATRQQTQVRSDDVITAQVHHNDPEPRLRFPLSNVNVPRSQRKNYLCYARLVQGPQSIKKKGGPFSVPQLEPDLGQGGSMEKYIASPSSKDDRIQSALWPRSSFSGVEKRKARNQLEKKKAKE